MNAAAHETEGLVEYCAECDREFADESEHFNYIVKEFLGREEVK